MGILIVDPCKFRCETKSSSHICASFAIILGKQDSIKAFIMHSGVLMIS